MFEGLTTYDTQDKTPGPTPRACCRPGPSRCNLSGRGFDWGLLTPDKVETTRPSCNVSFQSVCVSTAGLGGGGTLGAMMIDARDEEGMCRATRGDRRDLPCQWLRGLKLELSFRNHGGDAHGLGLKICPSFIQFWLPGMPWAIVWHVAWSAP